MKIYLAGRTELSRDEVAAIYEMNKYVCNRQGIFQPHYSNAQKDYYFSKVSSIKLSPRGRFYIFSAKHINSLVGTKILHEEE